MPQSLGEHTFVRHLRLATAVALPVLLISGCGTTTKHPPTTRATTATRATTTVAAQPATKPTDVPDEFADFKVAMDGSTDYLDPGLSDTAEGWGVMWNVYLPLIGYKHVSLSAGATLVPYLATALPQISSNGRVYTLRLRPGLRYSTGDPVLASDFKRTIERDIVLDSAGAPLFGNIAGVARFARVQKGGISGIRVDDKKGTIEIHLLAPEADFENVLASEFAAPVPSSAPRSNSELHPLPATGPYQIVSYQPRSRIVEVRNPYFQSWRFHGFVPVGNPDRVTWDIVSTAGAALRAVLSGKDDWMSYWPIPSKRLPGIEKRYATRLRKFTPPNLAYFFMNTHVPPFDNVAVRRAVNLAISRKWLVHLAGGLARSTENILPPGYPSYRKHRLYRHDSREAKKLIARAHLSKRAKRVIVWNHDVAADLPFTEYLVNVLNRLGFRAHEKVVTASNYWSTLGAPGTKAQIGFADWFQDYPHPLDWFGVLLDGRRTPRARSDNYAGFDVPSVIRQIETLTRQPKLTPGLDEQWALLDRQVMQLAPWAPFLNREEIDFFSARVRLDCYVNNILYGFDYAKICVTK